MTANDDPTRVHVAGSVTDQFPSSSIFESLAEASAFFEQGSLGYSDTNTDGKYDGLELNCVDWEVESLAVDEIQSSYFQDTDRFPDGDLCCGMPS